MKLLPSWRITWVRRRRGSRLPPSRGTTGRMARLATPISSSNWRRNPKSRAPLPVKMAKHVDGPVKVIWSREEDIQHDMYRPYYFDRLSAGLDAAGRPVAWTHRIAGSSIAARYIPFWFKDGLDLDAVEAAVEPPYALPNIHVDYVRVEPPGVRTAFWRGVGPTHNVFVVESFMDELAHAAKQDPVAYRKGLL